MTETMPLMRPNIMEAGKKNSYKILKKKVANDLGTKYVIQTPMKKKLKIKIFYVDKEDSENEQKFWQKIEEQNGFRTDSIKGKIVHISGNERSQRLTIIVEVDAETHKIMLEEEKVKIGWNRCKVQDYIGILRCFKCSCYKRELEKQRSKINGSL
ncbi:hypothetical protein X777_14651 [Ooceraea biroi]|uniref:Uncharacterized protein n=1 Tax=Ooceraea biroi TaxID=2015173 RepID=A0A026VW12_OOCBI|nr:hypothetical protein X777_14651 [Ooceraea biroi]